MKVVLSWSSGKDAAWALHRLRQPGGGRPGVEVVGLVTTVDEATGRVGMHGVPLAVVEAQAEAAGLPLRVVALPWPAPNAVYEQAVRGALAEARAGGATHAAFGDLFLADIRAYRERLLVETGLRPLFPLWHPPGGTAALARAMIRGGLRATAVCVDLARLDPSFAGRPFDESFLADLPAGVDPCGERGEFHTVCTAGPMFRQPPAGADRERPAGSDRQSLAVCVGGVEERGGFAYARVELAGPEAPGLGLV